MLEQGETGLGYVNLVMRTSSGKGNPHIPSAPKCDLHKNGGWDGTAEPQALVLPTDIIPPCFSSHKFEEIIALKLAVAG